MIKIENEKDIEALEKNPKSNKIVCRFLLDYIKSITSGYPEYTLKDYGAFYFLECQADSELHEVLHLSSPITQSLVEFSEVIIVQNGDEVIKLLHSCFIISNDFAISLFAEVGILDSSTEQHLLDERLEDRTVTVEV